MEANKEKKKTSSTQQQKKGAALCVIIAKRIHIQTHYSKTVYDIKVIRHAHTHTHTHTRDLRLYNFRIYRFIVSQFSFLLLLFLI